MRLFSWNVNGVRAIEKKGFLTWVDNVAPDILCIQETKANLINCLILFKVLMAIMVIGIQEKEKDTAV